MSVKAEMNECFDKYAKGVGYIQLFKHDNPDAIHMLRDQTRSLLSELSLIHNVTGQQITDFMHERIREMEQYHAPTLLPIIAAQEVERFEFYKEANAIKSYALAIHNYAVENYNKEVHDDRRNHMQDVYGTMMRELQQAYGYRVPNQLQRRMVDSIVQANIKEMMGLDHEGRDDIIQFMKQNVEDMKSINVDKMIIDAVQGAMRSYDHEFAVNDKNDDFDLLK